MRALEVPYSQLCEYEMFPSYFLERATHGIRLGVSLTTSCLKASEKMFSKLLEMLFRILAWFESLFYPHIKLEISGCQFGYCVFKSCLLFVNL